MLYFPIQITEKYSIVLCYLVRFPDPHYVVGRENEPLWDGAVFFRGP